VTERGGPAYGGVPYFTPSDGPAEHDQTPAAPSRPAQQQPAPAQPGHPQPPPFGPMTGPAPRQADSDFRRLHPLTPLLRGWKVFAAAVAIATQQLYGEAHLGWLLLGIAASIPLGAAYGVVSWRTTRFRIDSEDLRLETGVLFRRSRRVRLDRLQAVDVVRPLIARALGLAELRLEVAGGSSSEAPLAYLSEPAAQQLRAELLARAAGLHHDTPEAPESVLVKVPLARLVEGQVRSVGLIVAIIAAFVLVVSAAVTGQWSILGFAVPAAIGIVPAVVRSVIVHFDFTVAESPDGLRLRHGLLETRAQTVPPGRVQAVRIIEPLLWRSKGWCRVEVNVAGYVGSEGQARANVLLPVAPREEAFAVLSRVLPDVDVRSVKTYGVPRRARWCDPVSWRGNAAGADDKVFIARRGRFRRETDVVPHERVQSARLTQGPLQRRLGLATVHLDTSPGPVHPTAHHRDAKDARDLLDAEVTLARASRAGARPERWMRPPDGPAGPTVAR
jgi:putative membrane protein